MNEPIWLTETVVEAIHIKQINEHGGEYGVRDYNLLASALAWPINLWLYEEAEGLTALAAAYGYGLASNHGFIDGNKRVAFMAMYIFLGLNGYEIEATEPAVVDLMFGVADGSVSEQQLTAWLQEHVKKL